jgi:hypothetical protein
MAGMIGAPLRRRMEPAPGPAIEPRFGPGQAPPSNQGKDEDLSANVTPEEQQQYDRFVLDGMILIYEGGKVRQSILDLLDEDPSDLVAILGDVEELKQFSPVAALAATTVVLVLELVRRAGDRRPDDSVILHGGKEMLEELAHLAGEAGIHDYSQNELNRAFLIGMDLWRESASTAGLIDIEQLKAEFAEIKTADAQGRLGELFGSKDEASPPRSAHSRGGGDGLRR